MLAFMTAWCQWVSNGIMAHGPLLVHAKQCGHELVKTSPRPPDGSFTHFLVPKQRLQLWTQYNWQQHGHDGLAAITRFLKVNGFWSAPGLELADLAPPVVGQTTQEKNLALLSNVVLRAIWKDFSAPRGVELFIHDDEHRKNYEWCMQAGIPEQVESCVLRPMSSPTAMPGATQAVYYLQSKGHWFWAFFPHEGTGNLQVKWIRGRTPPGQLTKVLPHQPALTALMAAAAYSIPKGRIGRVASLAAAAASKLPTASAQFAAQGHVVVLHSGYGWWTLLCTFAAVMVVWFLYQWTRLGSIGDGLLGMRNRARVTITLDSTTQTPTILTIHATMQTHITSSPTATQTPKQAQTDASTMTDGTGLPGPTLCAAPVPKPYTPHPTSHAPPSPPLPPPSPAFATASSAQTRNHVSAVQIRSEIAAMHRSYPLTAADERQAIRNALIALGARCCGKVPDDFSGTNQYWTRIKCFVCGEMYQRVPAHRYDGRSNRYVGDR